MRCVAVLGRADEPTDAVEEYCQYLGTALGARRMPTDLVRVRWDALGWDAALRELHEKYPKSEDTWFLLQYTALAWSRRGFPWQFLRLIRDLQKRGARCAVVFHDAEGYRGDRLVDRIRRGVQHYTMRKAWELADFSVFTIPAEKFAWVTIPGERAVFIPVGTNLPAPELAWKETPKEPGATVAVFCVSGGQERAEELRGIAEAARFAAASLVTLRIVLLGRNSEVAGRELKEKLGAGNIELVVRGLLPAEEVARVLGSCDVMLFVRGPLSTRRGSAIAGIACGLPVVGRGGWETAAPITEAGVVIVEQGEELGSALLRVLRDDEYRAALAERSRQAYRRYFSWEVIAGQFAEAMSRARRD